MVNSQLVNILGRMDEERKAASMALVFEYLADLTVTPSTAGAEAEAEGTTVSEHEGDPGLRSGTERMRLFLIFEADVLSLNEGLVRASPNEDPEWILTSFRLPPPWPITNF